MNPTLVKAAIAFLPVSALFAYSLVEFARRKTVLSAVRLGGATCLVVVVLAHVCEAVHLFPAMRWGEAKSTGHYLDVSSAVIGITLLVVTVVIRAVRPSSPLR
jgi:succinate dehydrogenase/fumarate reductase cytochrome b subunit